NTSYFLYVFFVTLLPTIGIAFSKNIDFEKILSKGYYLLLATLLLSMWYNFTHGSQVSDDLRSGGNEVMGPLSYGHYGVSFALLSVFQLINKNNLFFKILYVLGIILGILVMYLAASRGPLLALFACLFFLFATRIGIVKTILLMTLLILPFVFFWQQIASF